MKIIFFGFPDFGHIYPTLELIKFLTQKNIDIIYYSTIQFKEDIENAGARFRNYPANSFIKKIINRDDKKNEIIDDYYSLFFYIVDNYLNIINDLCLECQNDNADIIINDSFAMWGKKVADRFGLPNVCSITSIAYPKKYITSGLSLFIEKFHPPFRRMFFSKFDKRLEEIIRRQLKVRSNIEFDNILNIFTNYSQLNIVYSSKSINPFIHGIDESFLFVGKKIRCSIADFDNDFLKEQDKPLIYISLGTVFSKNLTFYKNCIEALKAFNCNVILSINNEEIIKELGDTSENIKIYRFIPQIQVLEKASLFITHGGFNSITESLYYGVPMLLLPQAFDQYINAKIIHDNKCGIYLRENNPSVQNLKSMISKLLKDRIYKTRCEKIGKSLHKNYYELVFETLLELINT